MLVSSYILQCKAAAGRFTVVAAKPDNSKTPLANEVTADGRTLCSALQSASLATIAGTAVEIKALITVLINLQLEGFSFQGGNLGSGECDAESLRFAVRTDEGGGRWVDDSAGQQVKVVLHRVHHHRVACVVAALQADKQHAEERKINRRLGRFV